MAGVDGADEDLRRARSRVVALSGTSCGAADPNEGSGVALAPDAVLTAAHVVAEAGSIEVRHGGPGGRIHDAEVVAYDPRRDLAIVAPSPPLDGVPDGPAFAELAVGDRATVVGGVTSGDVVVRVQQVTAIEMDEVRGPGRFIRDGYLMQGVTGPGDSGAGLYDGSGRLAGVLFAVSSNDDNRSWVTASSEFEDFLDDESVRGGFACDPEESEIVRIDR